MTTAGRWTFAEADEVRRVVHALPRGAWVYVAYGLDVERAQSGGPPLVRVMRRTGGNAALVVGRYVWAYGEGAGPASAVWVAVRLLPVLRVWPEPEGPGGEGQAAMTRALRADREAVAWAVAERLRVEQGGTLLFRAGPVLERLGVGTSKQPR